MCRIRILNVYTIRGAYEPNLSYFYDNANFFFTFCNFAAITSNSSPTEKGNSFQLVQTASQKTTRNYKEKKK